MNDDSKNQECPPTGLSRRKAFDLFSKAPFSDLFQDSSAVECAVSIFGGPTVLRAYTEATPGLPSIPATHSFTLPPFPSTPPSDASPLSSAARTPAPPDSRTSWASGASSAARPAARPAARLARAPPGPWGLRGPSNLGRNCRAVHRLEDPIHQRSTGVRFAIAVLMKHGFVVGEEDRLRTKQVGRQNESGTISMSRNLGFNYKASSEGFADIDLCRLTSWTGTTTVGRRRFCAKPPSTCL